MGGLESILLGLGGKTLAKIIGKKFGAEFGELAQDAIGILAEAFGADPEPEAIEKRISEVQADNPQKAASAVAYAELQLAPRLLAEAEVWKAANEQQRMTTELIEAQLKTPGWRSDWLPAWQWFLMAAWGWTIFVAPIANAAIRIVSGAGGSPLATIDIGVLVTLTSAFLALHMGGHTVLELMRGGTFKRGDDK